MTRSFPSFKRIVLAGSLAGLAAAALAQAPSTSAAPPDATARQVRDAGRPDPAQRLAQREARLKQELQITAEQEPVWNLYTASMLPGPRAGRMDPDTLRKLNTPQRIEHMRAMQSERAAAMERRADATLRLYGALTPQQQALFDQRTAMGPRSPHPHHGMPPRPEHKG
ncbi:MAG TPA: Spy/CpxP family protein refolding chaperone [Pseudorhodoferax sp.]|nr:Spy/CpxP family protein refolding chaperone [Pseudorhodoferax sp.]